MRDEAFAKGMAVLATAFSKEPTTELTEVYHAILAPKLTDEEWQRAFTVALEREDFFPSPKKLLSYGRPSHVTASLASVAYGEILDHYERGVQIGPREIRTRFGRAAVEAFVAAGGPQAFAWCEPKNAPFRSKAFIETFEKCVEDDPDAGLALPPEKIEEAFGLPPSQPLALEKVVPSTLGHKSIERARRSGGFSVIEALIVVAILGICLAIAIPSCLRAKSEGVSMPPPPVEATITPNIWLDIQRKAEVNGRTIYAACDRQTKHLLYVVSYTGMNGNAFDAIAVVKDGCDGLR